MKKLTAIVQAGIFVNNIYYVNVINNLSFQNMLSYLYEI
jgi:hypothetical protein